MGAQRGVGLIVSIAALVVVCAASVLIGSKGLSWDELIHALTSPTGTATDQIIWDLRVPRTAVGIIVGAALGAAGALIQALTRNPLGDPGILGVNAGASLFVLLGVVVFGTATAAGYMWFAFLGAFVATAAVYLIGVIGARGVDHVRMTIAGVALGAVLVGIGSTITLLNPAAFKLMRGWEAGSFVERGTDVYLPVLGFVVVGLILAIALAHPLNALGLGDDLALALGAGVPATRSLTILAITLLAGGATAIAGPIAFVGLMVPHVARWIVGPDQRWIIPFSIVLAPTLLLVADIVGRVVLAPSEVPVGIVTAFIGAPVLIALVRRARVSAL